MEVGALKKIKKTPPIRGGAAGGYGGRMEREECV